MGEILPTSLPELTIYLRDLRNNQKSLKYNFLCSINKSYIPLHVIIFTDRRTDRQDRTGQDRTGHDREFGIVRNRAGPFGVCGPARPGPDPPLTTKKERETDSHFKWNMMQDKGTVPKNIVSIFFKIMTLELAN